MGMFDYIKCEYPLPIEKYQNRNFQTKDFDCLLKQYIVKKDGFLYNREPIIEDQSEYGKWLKKIKKIKKNLNAVLPTFNDSSDAVDFFSGMSVVVGYCWKVFDFTGEVNFYDFTEQASCKGWIEFKAFFKNGKLLYVIKLKEENE